MQIIESFQSWYRTLPDKKRYLEFISAFLSIPVLVTVVVLNLRSLKNQENQPQTAPIATQVIIKEVVIPGSPIPAPSTSPQPISPTPTPISLPSPSPSASPTPILLPTPSPDVSPETTP